MFVCSFSHTYSITIREASNIIQAGTTIITGQQASISLQGLHSSMESNKLTKILKRNVNLTNYEYPTKPISHTFTVLIYSLKKIQKCCFWGNAIKLSLHCSPFAFSLIEWMILLFIWFHLSSVPLSFQVYLACFLFDVFVCMFIYLFWLVYYFVISLSLLYPFNWVCLPFCLFSFLFIFHLSVNFPFLYSFVFSFKCFFSYIH